MFAVGYARAQRATRAASVVASLCPRPPIAWGISGTLPRVFSGRTDQPASARPGAWSAKVVTGSMGRLPAGDDRFMRCCATAIGVSPLSWGSRSGDVTAPVRAGAWGPLRRVRSRPSRRSGGRRCGGVGEPSIAVRRRLQSYSRRSAIGRTSRLAAAWTGARFAPMASREGASSRDTVGWNISATALRMLSASGWSVTARSVGAG